MSLKEDKKRFILTVLASEVLGQKMLHDEIDLELVVDNTIEIVRQPINDLYFNIIDNLRDMQDDTDSFEFINNVLDKLI